MHSQPSIEEQYKKAQQELETVQTKLAHSRSELQSVDAQLKLKQKTLQNQLNKAQEDHDLALSSLEEEVTKATQQAETAKADLVSDLDTLKAAVEAQKKARDSIVDRIVELNTSYNTLKDEYSGIENKLKVERQELDLLINQKKALHKDIITLDNDIHDIEDEKETLRDDLQDLRNKRDALNKVYEQEHGELTAELKKLQLEVSSLLEERDAIQEESDVTRQGFAKWEKTLQERDTNLRIREQKVQQGEAKLIRGSNLLKL